MNLPTEIGSTNRLTTTFPDALLIPLHGKAVTATPEWNWARVLLEPFGHFRPDTSALNVHQDQVRLMLARKIVPQCRSSADSA